MWDIYLIGALEHLNYFSHRIGNLMIPTDFQSIIFQRGRAQPPARYFHMLIDGYKSI